MDLTPAERSHLAMFFAKRFPTASDRSQLARAAAVVEPNATATSAHAAWERLLADAQEAGRLARLAHAAVEKAPEDDNLRRAAALIGPPASPWPKLALVTAAVAVPVAALFVIGVVAVSVGAFDGTEATAAPRAGGVASEPVAAVDAPSVDPVAVQATSEGAADDAVLPMDEAGADEPAVEAEPIPVADEGTADPVPPRASSRAPNASSTGPANHSGRCTQAGGGLIGYWYAGTSSPGSQGDVITVPRDMNVRAWVPSISNDFDARGPVRCVLVGGDRVRLTHAPVPVPVDSFWVPLYSGDIVSEN